MIDIREIYTNTQIHKKHCNRLSDISVCECSWFDFEQFCVTRTLKLTLKYPSCM